MTAPAAADQDRHARSRLVPGWDAGRLADATAVVIGVGALGNEVAKNLALAGVGRLVLCDPDVVAASNLSRTVLFTDADVGSPKPAAAAAGLRRLVPEVSVETRERDLVSGVGLGELADAGVVVGCLDSVHARMQLLGRCALAGAALVDGGTAPWAGEVRLRLHPDEPCFGCVLGAHQRSLSDHPWHCGELDAGGPAAASIVTTALVAAWASLAAVRVLLGTPPAFRIMTIDGLDGRAAPVGAVRDPECPHHRPLPPAAPIAVSHLDPVRALLAALPERAEPVAWTRIPVPPTCAACGARADVGRCLHCGAIVRARFTERLRVADPDARLVDLGVAPQEIISVRLPEGGLACRRLA